MDNLEGDELVIGVVRGGDEEEGSIATVDDFGVWREDGLAHEGSEGDASQATPLESEYVPRYSKKLQLRVRRARTSCVTSLTIFALSLGDSVVNHLARR